MIKRPRVLLTQPLLKEALEQLEQKFQIQNLAPGQSLSEACAHCDAAIVSLKDDFSATFFAQLSPQSPLKILANYAVGYDNIDLEAARQRGIWVTNTPDVLTEATAELSLGLLLNVSRRIGEGDRLIRTQQWTGWESTQLLGQGIRGKRLGIVGAGRIGQATARMAHALGMSILYHSRQTKPEFEQSTQAQYLHLNALCEQADIISIHLPGGKDTHHLIKASHFERMKPSALIINTGRGNVIDESALIHALQQGQIAGAGLDVFEREPQVPEALRNLPNVILTPHIGSATRETRFAMARVCWQNIEAALQGKRPPQAIFVFS